MRFILVLICCVLVTTGMGQTKATNHFNNSRQDLRGDYRLALGQVKIVGFGALHGSAKTEETEVILLKNLILNHNLKYYFPETDFSTAHYFQKYIDSGDEVLLESLIHEYGIRVSQEKSIEVFEKWKNIRPLFKNHGVQIIGVDKIASYKYSVMELTELVQDNSDWKYIDSLKSHLEKTKVNWAAYYQTETKALLERFADNYDNHQNEYRKYIRDMASFNHILGNLKLTFKRTHREHTIYQNYKKMQKYYEVKSGLQFFRMGVYHIMKSRINDSAPFFTRLIENKDYNPGEIKTIQGFLTKSRVLWGTKYNADGEYKGYATKGGYGIADYWLEYYQGIRQLKKNKTSDLCLFDLQTSNGTYLIANGLDLVNVKTLLGRSYWKPTGGSRTIDYLDFAILISESKANRPIEILKTE